MFLDFDTTVIIGIRIFDLSAIVAFYGVAAIMPSAVAISIEIMESFIYDPIQ